MTPSPRSRSFSKLPKLKEEIDNIINSGMTVPFIAITESWLKDHIHDSQIYIDNFNVFRSDRKVSKNGGVVLYIHDKITVSDISYFDDDTCGGVICVCKNVKCIIACVYRPPNCAKISFSNLLNFVSEFIISHNPLNKMNVIIFGDFNFPQICWESLDFCSDSLDLCSFMEKFFLSQYVRENTRKNNILDLFITDDCNFAELVKVNNVNFSDHNIVKNFTNFFSNLSSTKITSNEQVGNLDFSKINYNLSDFESINFEFSKVDWDKFSEGPVEEFPEKFHRLVYSIVSKHSKLKPEAPKCTPNYIQRRLNTINRKLRKCKKLLLKYSVTNQQKFIIMNKRIVSLENQKIETILNARLNEERRALENIRKNNKYFFKYANKFRKTPSSPNILLDEHDNPIISHKKIADALQDQFKGVFSIPKNDSDFDHSSFNNNKKPSVLDLPDLVITEKDVILAINEIKIDSKCPNYDIPAIIIKNCKYTLCKPLKLFYQKSFNTGIVPRKYKTQLIIPLFKKGIKTKAQNYRPISLTSHIIKIFERILRKYLTFYFEVNHFFNNNQHGFRSERSCSTQLLAHITHILTNSSNGHDTDCIYVDYAKAFDKIDHGLLLKKLHSYSIPKSYINWIKNFLMERTQTVYLNNNFSYPTPVMSGVPQGSVLGPLLFIIYINDMPDVICNSQILTFADDTKIVSKISTTDDTLTYKKTLIIL